MRYSRCNITGVNNFSKPIFRGFAERVQRNDPASVFARDLGKSQILIYLLINTSRAPSVLENQNQYENILRFIRKGIGV